MVRFGVRSAFGFGFRLGSGSGYDSVLDCGSVSKNGRERRGGRGRGSEIGLFEINQEEL